MEWLSLASVCFHPDFLTWLSCPGCLVRFAGFNLHQMCIVLFRWANLFLCENWKRCVTRSQTALIRSVQAVIAGPEAGPTALHAQLASVRQSPLPYAFSARQIKLVQIVTTESGLLRWFAAIQYYRKENSENNKLQKNSKPVSLL